MRLRSKSSELYLSEHIRPRRDTRHEFYRESEAQSTRETLIWAAKSFYGFDLMVLQNKTSPTNLAASISLEFQTTDTSRFFPSLL